MHTPVLIDMAETVRHYLLLVRHMYRLEKEDLVYVTESCTDLLNWVIPSGIGGWLVKRLYLMEHTLPSWKVRIGLSVLPLALPVLSAGGLYFLSYRSDPRLPALRSKYPYETDFAARPKISMIRKRPPASSP